MLVNRSIADNLADIGYSKEEINKILKSDVVQITNETIEKLKDKIDAGKLKSLTNEWINRGDLKQELTKYCPRQEGIRNFKNIV